MGIAKCHHALKMPGVKNLIAHFSQEILFETSSAQKNKSQQFGGLYLALSILICPTTEGAVCFV